MNSSAARTAGEEDEAARALSPEHRDRFWSMVAKGEGCWLWQKSTNQNGYGRLNLNGRRWAAHRLAFVLAHGTIDSTRELDHLCRNRACCNPAHLEPVSHRENTMRGQTIVADHATKTHCANGHPFDAQNTADARAGKKRVCRTCERDRGARYREKQRSRHVSP